MVWNPRACDAMFPVTAPPQRTEWVVRVRPPESQDKQLVVATASMYIVDSFGWVPSRRTEKGYFTGVYLANGASLSMKNAPGSLHTQAVPEAGTHGPAQRSPPPATDTGLAYRSCCALLWILLVFLHNLSFH